MLSNKELSDFTESFAKRLLEQRGYTVGILKTANQTYDLTVTGGTRSFLVSVTVSRNKQQVQLGDRPAVNRLGDGNFVFAFMSADDEDIQFTENSYRLLIIPSSVAKEDGLNVHDSYSESRGTEYNFSVMVKGYTKRQLEIDVWTRWQSYADAWDSLPPLK